MSSTIYLGALALALCCTCGRVGYDATSPRDASAAGDATTIMARVEPAYPNHANWNEYVANAGGPRYAQADADCVVDAGQGYNSCVHAGEIRSFASGLDSCTGLSATDELDAFLWSCDDSSGEALFYSLALRSGKGLRDLVDPSGFQPNSLTLSNSAGPLIKSTASVWWNNPVLELPDNSQGSAATVLDVAGGIYVVPTTRDSQGYNINADGIALVVEDGAVLRLVPGADNCNEGTGEATPTAGRCIVAFGEQNFLWFEGSHNASDSSPFVLRFSSFVVLRDMSIENGNYGLLIRGLNHSLITGLTIGSSGNYGIIAGNSHYNVWHDLVIGNSGDTSVGQGRAGMLSSEGSSHNTITKVTIGNMRERGVLDIDSINQTYSHLTIANLGYRGFTAGSTSGLTVNQVATLNARDGGIAITNSDSCLLSQIAASHSLFGVVFDNNTSSTVTGNLKLGNGTNCSVSGDDGTGLTSSCDNFAGSDARFSPGLDLSSSFVGALTTDDIRNTTDQDGSQNYSSAIDWSHFDNRYRTWGKDAQGYPGDGQHDACYAGQCNIWDWRLRNTDTQLFNRSGVSSNLNDAFVPGAPCPVAASGNTALQDSQGNRFLVNALESMFDGVGDDDGLCESNEDCIYSPHFGSYQGEGALSAPCQFQDGSVSGVLLRSHETL